MTQTGVYVAAHNYNGYTNGCRCEICRAAKATYMREKRQGAARERDDAAGEYVAPGITHGTYAGYADSACRCGSCKQAKADADRGRRRRDGAS